MSTNTRSYSYELIIYDVIPSVLVSFLKSLSFVSNYLFILHDKDFKIVDSVVTVEPAVPHIHCTLTLYRERSIHNLVELLNNYSSRLGFNLIFRENMVENIHSSLSDVYLYYLHRIGKDSHLKFQYNIDDLFSSDIKRFCRSYGDENNRSFSILMDLENGVPLRLMASKYGRDFILHYQQYRDFLLEMKYDDNSRLNTVSEETNPIQIALCDVDVSDDGD